MTHAEDKKNQRIAMITSLTIHGVIFLLLFFLVAWKAPNPPHPEIGIVVNWGEDDQGSGDTQPDKSAGSEGTQEEQPNQPDPVPEEPQVQPEEVVESKPVEQEVVSQVESPVVVKEKKEEVKQPEKPVEKTEPKKEPEKPKVDENALFKPKTATTNNKTSEAKAGQNANEGDDVNKTGNKGQTDGTLDKNAVYKGPAGGGNNGLGLQMPGWAWVSQPQPKGFTSTLSGKVRFEIEVDENGDIIGINTLERTLNFEDERMLKALIQKSRLEKTSPGDAPPKSKGIVEFTLRLE